MRLGMRWEVIVLVGTPLWSRPGFEFGLGKFRWLWLARVRAWWHLQNYPYREAGIRPVDSQHSMDYGVISSDAEDEEVEFDRVAFPTIPPPQVDP